MIAAQVEGSGSEATPTVRGGLFVRRGHLRGRFSVFEVSRRGNPPLAHCH